MLYLGRGCQLTALLSITALQQLADEDSFLLLVDSAPLCTERVGRGEAHTQNSLQQAYIPNPTHFWQESLIVLIFRYRLGRE